MRSSLRNSAENKEEEWVWIWMGWMKREIFRSCQRREHNCRWLLEMLSHPLLSVATSLITRWANSKHQEEEEVSQRKILRTEFWMTKISTTKAPPESSMKTQCLTEFALWFLIISSILVLILWPRTTINLVKMASPTLSTVQPITVETTMLTRALSTFPFTWKIMWERILSVVSMR